MEAYAGKSFQMQIIFNIFPRISLHCKLVPVQYWEYEYGLLQRQHFLLSYFKTLSDGPAGVELTTSRVTAGRSTNLATGVCADGILRASRFYGNVLHLE